MDYRDIIAGMKADSRAAAEASAIAIRNQQGAVLGKLVPVGAWILEDRETVELMSSWRARAMRMFLTQFESTYERTLGYLKNRSVANEGCLFFMLHDDTGRLVGHMGLAGVDGVSAELDNFMRGVEGGDPRLVYYAELALLDWCFKRLGLTHSVVQVLSYNWLVLDLHEEVGYALTATQRLRKYDKDGMTFHDVATPEDSNVKYNYIKMELAPDAFYARAPWLA
jgi:RimJ/RimL family protein N-acetyltransferase